MSTPARRSPANEMKSRTSRGMLRNVSTYTPPSRWSQGDGATRSAATTVPTTSAIASDRPTMRRVTQNPEANWSKLSVRTSNKDQALLAHVDGLFQGHRRGLLLLLRVLPDPLLVGLGPAAALLPVGDDVADELLQLLVAVLDADAVGLGRQLLAL